MMEFSDDDVRAILQLLDASEFNELKLETDEFRLWLRRSADGGWSQETVTLGTPLPAPGTPADPAGSGATGGDAPPAIEGQVEVRAPLPGTFYRAPKPGSAPFVEIGSPVEPQTVVAIVETMKLMNSIPAGSRGRISAICLRDAEFAAQGAVLMRIRPDA